MSFEIDIVSIGQSRISKFRENLSIVIENEKEHEEAGRFFEIWPTMCC